MPNPSGLDRAPRLTKRVAVINTGKAHTEHCRLTGCGLGSSPYFYELQISVFRIIDICKFQLRISVKELQISIIELRICANITLNV